MSTKLTLTVPSLCDSVYCRLLHQQLTPAKKVNAYRCTRCHRAQKITHDMDIWKCYYEDDGPMIPKIGRARCTG
jgi:hypothetical protein